MDINLETNLSDNFIKVNHNYIRKDLIVAIFKKEKLVTKFFKKYVYFEIFLVLENGKEFEIFRSKLYPANEYDFNKCKYVLKYVFESLEKEIYTKDLTI